MKSSTLTFKDLTENLAYIKVFWNGEVIFDDTETNPNYLALHLPEDFEGWVPEYDLFDKTKDYINKKVYSMKVTIVKFHHCILYIRGEK